MIIKRILASCLVFAVMCFFFKVSGLHKCHEGAPPMALGYLTGVIAAGAPWFIKKLKWVRRLIYCLLLLMSIITAKTLASSYHANEITGNPDMSSGLFWHTSITGQYPRDAKKTEAFYKRMGIPSQPEQSQSEQAAPSNP